MAEEMFKEIRGKTRARYGFAMIATKEIKKGTFIIQEKPQLVWKNPTGVPQTEDSLEIQKEMGIAEIKGIHAAFNNMKKSDQDEYLQLWNYFDHLNLAKSASKKKWENMKSNISSAFPDFTKNEIALAMKIQGIYKSNSDHNDTFVSIKAAKFNHSCNANAIIGNSMQFILKVYKFSGYPNTSLYYLRIAGRTDHMQCDIIAVSKILCQEEIAVNFAVEALTMQNFQTRQKYLLKYFGFKCRCDLCQEEERDGDNFRYELFRNMDDQAARLTAIVEEGFFKGKNHAIQIFRQLIQCHKEKYKYAKECNAHRRFIIYKIVDPGFDDATGAYLYAKQIKDSKLMEEFKTVCVNFAKVAVQLAKIVVGEGSPAYETWKHTRDHFEEFVEENQAIHENTKPEGAYTPLNLNRNLKFKRNFYK